jgi:hypothetical protein
MVVGENDRDIAHAGTRKVMPSLASGATDAEQPPDTLDDDRDTTAPSSPPAPLITSEQTDFVAGEIVAEVPPEPTDKTTRPAGADKIAAERGMPPLRKPPRRPTRSTRRAPAARRSTKLGVSPFRKR